MFNWPKLKCIFMRRGFFRKNRHVLIKISVCYQTSTHNLAYQPCYNVSNSQTRFATCINIAWLAETRAVIQSVSDTLTRTFQEKVHWRADGGVFWQQHSLGIRLKSPPSTEKQRIKPSSGSRELLPRFYPVKAVKFLYFHYAREGMSEHNSWVTIYCEWKLYLIS